MTTAWKARWTRKRELELAGMWGRMPLSDIAAQTGRSEEAIQVKVRKMKLKPPTKWPNLLTATRLAEALGLACPKVAIKLLRSGLLPTLTVYVSNTPVTAVTVRQLRRWLADPLNWWCLDVDKITDPRFAPTVQHTKRHWQDEWLTPSQAQDLLYYSLQGLNKLILSGRLPARRRGNWWILKSDALAFMEGYA